MNNESTIILSPRAKQAIVVIEQRIRSEDTLTAVISNPLVRSFARWSHLTTKQRELIATVVSIMQDHLIADLRENNAHLKEAMERESFARALFSNQTAAALGRLYSAPLFTLPGSVGDPAVPIDDAEENKSFVDTVFTWGNLCAASSIILIVIEMFYTKAYASFKDRAESEATVIEQNSKRIDALTKERDEARNKANEANGKQDKTQAELEMQRGLTNSFQTQIKELNDRIGDLSLKAGAAPEVPKLQAELEQKNQMLQQMAAELAKADSEQDSARGGENLTVAGEQIKGEVWGCFPPRSSTFAGAAAASISVRTATPRTGIREPSV